MPGKRLHCDVFELYTTASCTLCEQALALVLGIEELAGSAVDCVDVIEDAELLARYGDRIPVLRHLGTQQEVCWPFTRADVLRLVMTHSGVATPGHG